MTSLRNIVFIFVLCAVLALTLGQFQQNNRHYEHGSHFNQIRVRRQLAEEELQENVTLENAEEEKGVDDNQGEEEISEISEQEQNFEDVIVDTQDQEDIIQEIVEEEVQDQADVDLENEEQVLPENEEQSITPENEELDAIPEDEPQDVIDATEAEIPENEEQEEIVTENEDLVDVVQDTTTPPVSYPFWTTCDFYARPIKSCYDCHNILICKPIGGLVKPCGNPFRPYCNHGNCSPVPSAECV